MALAELNKKKSDKELSKDGKVRKFRRSHKNSRDGCPNCKAKRVKCTEELPSCANCVRRRLRCGYLDFPPERLELISKKNEITKSKASESSPTRDCGFSEFRQDSLMYPSDSTNGKMSKNTDDKAVLPKQEYNGVSNSPIPHENGTYLPPSAGLKIPFKRRKSVIVKKPSETKSRIERIPSIGDFRSVAYSNALNRELGLDKEKDLWNIPDSVFSDSIFLSNFDTLGVGKVEGKTDSTYSQMDFLVINGMQSMHELFPPELKREMDGGAPKLPSSLLEPFEMPNIIESRSVKQLGNKVQCNPSRKVPGSPLTNATRKITTFKQREIPEKLRNVFIEKTMAKLKLHNFTLKNIRNDIFSIIPKPVWTQENAESFWISIIQQLSALNLYFLYFINKAANILVRASAAVINGDIDISILPNSTFSSSPSLPVPIVHPFSFFYTPDDLDMLVQKSYSSFGRLIRTLRESINEYHEEYPAKMSLVSAWGCYFHLISNMGTFCLMMSGTFALIQKCLTQSNHISEVTIAVRREMEILKHFYYTALYPDYSFELAQSLIKSFQNYRNFVQYLIESYEAGNNFETDLVQVLKDPLFRHDYHETNKFLDRLQNHFHSTSRNIDNYCKKKCSCSSDESVRFLSPTLIFELAFEWFQVYRGDLACLNKKANPLKKTLYVFLNALGKVLGHIFPSLKYASYVDPCNVAFCKVGFVAPEFDPWDRPQYHPIAPMYMDFTKTIKFFENRLKLCGYLADSTVQSKKFITKVPLGAPSTWKYRDIIHLSAKKLPLKETQLKSMTNVVIQCANYPFFDALLQDPVCATLIKAEQDRQHNALYNEPKKYCSATGMLNHDFDATKIVDQYILLRPDRDDSSNTNIESSRELNEHMNQCRLEITTAIQAASASEQEVPH